MRITGRMPAATISSAASAPSSKLPRRGELVDVGRQGLDVERPQQQRHRQFLQAIDEDQQCRRPQRRPQQRQMDAAHDRERTRARHAGDVVEFAWQMRAKPACTKPMEMARKRTV